MSVSLVEIPLLSQSPTANLVSSGAPRAKLALHGHTVWHINTTANGGGVAELLRRLIPQHTAAGIPAKWLTLSCGAEFFAVTKRLHHRLHGHHDRHGAFDSNDERIYADATRKLSMEVLEYLTSGDICVLHDPQTLGLAPVLSASGMHVVWRCHIGSTEHTNQGVCEAWEFLEPYLNAPDRCAFSVIGYAPPVLPSARLVVIPPSIDPLAAKNRDLPADEAKNALRSIGLETAAGDLSWRSHGVRAAGEDADMAVRIVQDQPVSSGAEVVLQVARWDPLKDMEGLLAVFAEHIAPRRERAHLVLAGPEPGDIPDDPEGAEIFGRVYRAWLSLPAITRKRVHLVTLPLRDATENALLVNVLQRWADVIVQKSLQEGFGLTVTEAMWKRKAIVASRVGGISTQLRHEHEGLLLTDPQDGAEFANHVLRLLADPTLREQLGCAAHRRCAELFLVEREIADHRSLYRDLLDQSC